jgi:hypothetical protein
VRVSGPDRNVRWVERNDNVARAVIVDDSGVPYLQTVSLEPTASYEQEDTTCFSSVEFQFLATHNATDEGRYHLLQRLCENSKEKFRRKNLGPHLPFNEFFDDVE